MFSWSGILPAANQSYAEQPMEAETMLLDQKTQEIVAEIRNYNIPINREQRIELFTDGLCENPGAMHIVCSRTRATVVCSPGTRSSVTAPVTRPSTSR